jgi:hypothetical protein
MLQAIGFEGSQIKEMKNKENYDVKKISKSFLYENREEVYSTSISFSAFEAEDEMSAE